MIGRDFTITLLAIAVTFVAVLWLQVRHEFRAMLPLYHAALRRINQLRDVAIAKEAQRAGLVPLPTPDSFLELADLRRQLFEAVEDLDRVTKIAGQSAAVCGQLERSNAALRGKITMMTASRNSNPKLTPPAPKKKVKK